MRAFLIGMGVFFLLAVLTQILAWQRYLISAENEIRKAVHEVNTVRDRLKSSLSYSLSATKTLAFIVENYGVPDPFETVGRDILGSNKFIDAIELTRKGVITHVYPLEGHERAIGYDVLADSLRNKEALESIERNELFFAGPLELRQGGLAVVGRLPIYKDGSFWGFSVVIIRLPTLLEAAGITAVGTDYHVQLSKINPSTNKEEFFLSSPVFTNDPGHVASIDVPDGEWKLYVKPKNELAALSEVLPVSFMGILLSLTAGIFSWHLAKQPERLGRLVKVKTIQANRLNRLYHLTARLNQLMVQVNDEKSLYQEVCRIAVEVGGFRMAWIAIIGGNGKYALPMASAGEEHGYLQKITPIDIRPGALEGPVVKVLRTGEFVYCNNIATNALMKPWANEALSRGYRSSILLPVRKFDRVIGSFNLYSATTDVFDEQEIRLLQEVTDDISFTLGNIEKERMLKQAHKQIEMEKVASDSIINSLPGIFYMYDVHGKFVRWNTNFEAVSGYSGAEISRMYPSDFFHPEEKELVRIRIAEVFEKGVSDVMTKFYTKDKRRIPFYFNGRKVTFNGVDYLVGMGIDITQLAETEKKLTQRTEEIQKLTGYLQQVREEERTSIAREIHDVLGQQLTALKMDSSWLRKHFDHDQASTERLTGMTSLIDDTIRTVRRIASQLRPGILDDLGLVAALEWQANDFEKRTGIATRFSASHQELSINEKLSTNIFRIFQEALTNIARHANAKDVEVRFDLNESDVTLTIRDNGVGMDPDEIQNRGSLGIIGMKERAHLFRGELLFEKNDPQGTVVTLRAPINFNTQADYEFSDFR